MTTSEKDDLLTLAVATGGFLMIAAVLFGIALVKGCTK